MGRAIELKEGDQYGRWTIIKRDPEKHKNNYAYWICKCSCGTIKSVKGRDLRLGQSLSCGCLNKELSSKRNKKDLTGQTFGHLTVIKEYPERKNNHVYWECQCDCGNPNIKIVKGSHLRDGSVSTCGVCAHFYNKDNDNEHDFLKKLDYDFKTRKWNVQCKKCGNIVQMAHDNYKRNISCGCIKSLGEQKISEILTNNKISYEKEKIFDNFISPDGGYFRFDFYINNKYIIEYDGEQHFKVGTGHFNNPEKFQKTKEYDEIKNKWCKENNIPLIRIPYTHLKDLCLEDLILETSKFVVEV